MTRELNLGNLMREGVIIDNKRVFGGEKLTLREVLMEMATHSQCLKSAVGYFYIEGLSQIIFALQGLREIKILMGGQTSPRTKEELIKAFQRSFDRLDEDALTVPAIALFHRLVQDESTLKVRVLFGNGKFKRLHSKMYLFLRDCESKDILERHRAGIIGSSNLTPSGLMGNTELNVIIDRAIDLAYLEEWFDELWEEGSESFEDLRVSLAISQAISQSKFANRLDEAYQYLNPRTFFIALIKFLRADYLFEDWKESGLFGFQVVDTIRCLRLFRENRYRGVLLTSSVGLGKSYVACKIAEIYHRESSRVLIIAPANLVRSSDMWQRYLREFGIHAAVDLVSMGELQEHPSSFFEDTVHGYTRGDKISLNNPNTYGLIIVDEAHNYRNEDAYRTRNLKRIIDLNGDAKVMFLTATPINTSLDDLLSLVRLFHRPGQNPAFDRLVRNLADVVKLITKTEFENLTDEEKERIAGTQQEIERELFVKSTRETIKISEDYVRELEAFSGVDIREIPDPNVKAVRYSLHRIYKPIVNNIISFINGLTIAHLRLVDPERGVRLGGFFKWLLYKRFESSITAYHLTLRRLARRNEAILLAIEKRDIIQLETETDDDIDIDFGIDFRAKLERVIQRIEEGQGQEHLEIVQELVKDTELIKQELAKLAPYVLSSLRFKNDKKMERLARLIRKNSNERILIFTQYKDTLDAIRSYLEDRVENNSVRYVSSEVQNKDRILDSFNDPESDLQILVATDTLSEGYNISGADIVVNFDIPYNPVRIIQRIGRATRLDTPKLIHVMNFKPDRAIDRELELVERMDLRMKDIIKFVGVDYRIWIDRANEIRGLLHRRRLRDVEIYREVLKSIRADLTEGRYVDLEVAVEYTRPILVLLQKAIRNLGVSLKDIQESEIPERNAYTVLEGNRSLTVFYSPSDVYNEEALSQTSIGFDGAHIHFEREFAAELKEFSQALISKQRQLAALTYYTDRIDVYVNSILDILSSNRLSQLYPSASRLEDNLRSIKDSCGSTTDRVLRGILRNLKRGVYDNSRIAEYDRQLEESFTKREVQETLVNETSQRFALALLKEDS